MIVTAGGNPANGIGGPGSCRAKWAVESEDDGDTAIISNADIVAAFNDVDVPPELLAVINGTYGSDAAAAFVTSFGMRFELMGIMRAGAGNIACTPRIDGLGKLTLEVAMSENGDQGQVVLQFNHSVVR